MPIVQIQLRTGKFFRSSCARPEQFNPSHLTTSKLTFIALRPIVPPYIVAFVWTLSLAWLSSRIDRRGFVLLATSPFAIAGYILFVATGLTDVNARYVRIYRKLSISPELTLACRLGPSSAFSAPFPLAPI